MDTGTATPTHSQAAASTKLAPAAEAIFSRLEVIPPGPKRAAAVSQLRVKLTAAAAVVTVLDRLEGSEITPGICNALDALLAETEFGLELLTAGIAAHPEGDRITIKLVGPSAECAIFAIAASDVQQILDCLEWLNPETARAKAEAIQSAATAIERAERLSEIH